MYEPKRPTLAALGLMNVWIAILAIPMLAGKWLGAPGGDFNPAAFASRTWGAEWWHRLGHVPLWEPELFGGMPYVGAGHGDIFYATSFLRLILPIATVVNFGFILHYVLAGLFTYLLLRRLGVSWGGSVVGGVAYELSGLLASYPSPGHDGKLFASAALPLAFLALVMALRDKRAEGYALLAIAIAASLLGHFQLAYYSLIAAGLFALYLTLEQGRHETTWPRFGRLGLRLGLYDCVVPRGELDAKVKHELDAILQCSPSALAACKRLIAEVPGLERGAAISHTAQVLADLWETDDAREGIAAFAEKRKPRWSRNH